MFNLAILFIIFICVALMHSDGMWSNAVRLINVVTAGLLAMNFFEPLADWLDKSQPAYTFLWDFVSMWGLFIIFSLIFRALTDQLSKVKVRFSETTERIGSIFFSLWVAWVITCFTMASLHTAPLAKNFLFGYFVPEEKSFFGLGPDRIWLGFTQKMSMGPYEPSVSDADWKAEKTIFDPHGEFLPNYASRRINVENNVNRGNSLLTGK